MASKLTGRTALVTGAARGQGRASALRLARDGADILALDIGNGAPEEGYALATSADLEETARLVEKEGRRVASALVDVRNREALAGFAAQTATDFPRLDVIVAAAGIVAAAPLGGPAATWDRVIDTNLTGVYNTVAAFAPRMVEAGNGGSIVFLSSVAGLKGLPLFGAYGAAKHGLQGLMKAMAQELGRHGIRVNTINPGGVTTTMTTGNDELLALFGKDDPDAELFRSSFIPVMPVEDGWIRPDQIADVIAFLASDEARYITGQAVPIDGGVMVH